MYPIEYRLGPKHIWKIITPALCVVIPDSDRSLERPERSLRAAFKSFESATYMAARETTVGALKRWLARGAGIRKHTDRQRALGGIYDRGYLRKGLAAIGIHKTAHATSVRIEAAQSPNRTHLPGECVLKVRIGDAVCYLMCCREGTATGKDPLRIGRAA